MTTYRWAVVNQKGVWVSPPFESERECLNWFRADTHGGIPAMFGYRVAKFKLVECEEGEGDGE